MGASVGASRGGRRGGIVGINVTPMVDVMLVLLVIMMVSATYIVSRALKVELPKSATSDEAAQAPITVTHHEGRQDLRRQRGHRRRRRARRRASRRRARRSGDPSLVVTADTHALHGWVVHVIDLAKQQGITKFAINVASE